MGRPVHYSSEVPARCQALINQLIDRVEEHSDPDGQWGGPLKTTFLLAMATPMLVLPLERIFKPAVWSKPGIADDLALDMELDGRVRDVLGPERAFGAAPFFRPNTWSYVPDCPAFKVARNWPDEQLAALDSKAAGEAAELASASQVLLTMRNALSHGGITYLDRDGRHTLSATNMLGFASLVKQNDLDRLRLLRTGVPDFQLFLRLWVEWLTASGADRALEERGPGYFEQAAA
jgi:hypothetical protein